MLRNTLFCLSLLMCGVAHAQSFTVADTLRPGSSGTAAWGDYDGDGRPDLAYFASGTLPGQQEFLYLYHNTAAGMQLADSLTPLTLARLCWADLNNDGKEDLICCGVDAGGMPATIVYGYTGSGFAVMPVLLPGYHSGAVDVADYNNDGWKDIVMSGVDTNMQISTVILKGTGLLIYTALNAGILPCWNCVIKWGDYGNDGLADLVMNGQVANDSNATVIYHNAGSDSFQPLPGYRRGSLGTADWLDADNDGFPDILITGVDSGFITFTHLHHNNGNGTFSLLTTNLPAFGEPSAVAVADYNGDGLPDICFGGGTDANLEFSALAINLGGNTFQIDSFYTGDINNCIVAAADFDLDGRPDLMFNNLLLRNDGAPAAVAETARAPLQLTVAPNPAGERAILSWEATRTAPCSLTLHSAAGQALRRAELRATAGHNRYALDLAQLPAGLYYVTVAVAGSSATVALLKR